MNANYIKIKSIYCSLLLMAGLTYFTSCKKDTDNPPATTTTTGSTTGTSVQTGKLMMHLHNYVGTNEVDDYNIVYKTPDGRKLSMSSGQFYISNIQLVKADGSIYNVPNTALLKLQDVETYTIGDVPAGNYKSIRFLVGLDSATNKKIPSASSDDIFNKSAMWFGIQAQPEGYVYLNFQGKIDTTVAATASDAQMVNFFYRIGTTANAKLVSMPDKNFTLVANSTEYIHLMADYSVLFNGISLGKNANLSVSSVGDNNSAVAKTLVNNIPSMFSYEM